MTKIEFSDNEMQSLSLLVEYLIDNERNHYCAYVGDIEDGRDADRGQEHIYLHAKRIEKLLEK